MCACFGLSQYSGPGFFRLLFLRVACEYNRPSFLATVFSGASAFNGDLNQWDVAKVTTMAASKSIRIGDWRVQSGVGVGGEEKNVTFTYENRFIRIFENDFT
jgi:surface protein